MTEIIIAAISGGIITKLLDYIFNYRRGKAALKSNELDNVEKAVKIWRELSEGQQKEIEDLKDRLSDIEEVYRHKCANCRYRKAHIAAMDKKSEDGQ